MDSFEQIALHLYKTKSCKVYVILYRNVIAESRYYQVNTQPIYIMKSRARKHAIVDTRVMKAITRESQGLPS